MKKKKICFIAQFPPPIHGLSKAVDTLYNSYLKDEFEFEKIDITNNKKFLRNLIKVLKNKADLFYFTISQTKGGNIRDLIIFKLLELKKKKCLIHLHGGYYRNLVDNDIGTLQRKLNYKAINKLEGVIVLSESLKAIFKGMIDDEKIYVVPNCVDNEFLISDDEFNQKMEEAKNKDILNVLYLSNFIKSKGYPEVLEMARLEKERCDSGEKRRFHFDFAGKFLKKIDEDFFFEYIKKYKLENYISYHGVVGGEKKRKLLRDSNIFVLLTTYPNEGQPISILEAMGNGMIIITTNHAGIPDIVKQGNNGIVLDKKNINIYNIYKYIETLANNRLDLQMIMKENYNYILMNFTEKEYINNINYIFNNERKK